MLFSWEPPSDILELTSSIPYALTVPLYQTNTQALFIEFAQKKEILLSLAGYMKYLEGEVQSTRCCHLYLTQERFASSNIAIVKDLCNKKGFLCGDKRGSFRYKRNSVERFKVL
jgi:hypothetical protein